jgi:hypothetical protein
MEASSDSLVAIVGYVDERFTSRLSQRDQQMFKTWFNGRLSGYAESTIKGDDDSYVAVSTIRMTNVAAAYASHIRFLGWGVAGDCRARARTLVTRMVASKADQELIEATGRLMSVLAMMQEMLELPDNV